VRTHLLRTFYPPVEAEPEAGAAANDTVYEPPAAITILKPSATMPAAKSADDDYQLGGYAGI
jgi:hypothetical protein